MTANTIAQWLGVAFALLVPCVILASWPSFLRTVAAILLAQASAVGTHRAAYRAALAEQRRALSLPEVEA